MIFKKKQKIKEKIEVGDIRIVKLFALAPVDLGDHYVWLEHFYVKQMWWGNWKNMELSLEPFNVE